MQPVSSSGPADGENPFEGIPFLGDLGKMLGGLGSGGGLQWDTARQVAMQIASGGESEANIDPKVRIELEELARIAEMHIENLTGLSTTDAGTGVTVLPVTRTQWTQRSFDAFKPLFEALATSLASDGSPAAGTDIESMAAGQDPMSAMLGQLMGAMAPMMLSVTAGGMLGHLAQRSFGQYDLPVPRTPSDEILLVSATVDAFAADWSIEVDELRLWLCLHEILHHAVLRVPHVRASLESMILDYASSFRPDASGLVDRLESLDISNPSALGELQSTLGDPEVMLGAIQTDEQRSMMPRLETLVAVIEGFVDHAMDQIGRRLIGRYAMITEALRRRRVEADDSDRFVARLFGLEIGQATYERGGAFISGVVEREDFDALAKLWDDERFLPTPAELDAPGLWLARIELPTDD